MVWHLLQCCHCKCHCSNHFLLIFNDNNTRFLTTTKTLRSVSLRWCCSCCCWCCFLLLLMLLLQMLFLVVVVVVVFNLRALFQDTLGQRVLHFWRYQSCSVTCVNLIFFLTFFSIYYTPFDLFTSAKRYCDRTCLLVS